MAVRKLRAGVVGGIAMLGAGVMLSACSPVQMGAAAIVGNQRISQSTLSANVTDLQNAMAKYPAQELQMTPARAPRAMLGLLVQFDIWDRVAKNAGISVTPTEVSEGVARANQQWQQQALAAVQQNGGSPNPKELQTLANVMALDFGVTPQLTNAFGRNAAQQIAVETKLNGGKPVATQAEFNRISPKLSAAINQAVTELNIKINPQYGKLDPAQGTIVAGPDLLSKPASGAAPVAPAAS